MSELHCFDELSREKQLAIAIRVANCSSNDDAVNRIVPVTVEEIMDTEWALVATVGGKFAGYIRHKERFIHETTFQTYQSIGTLLVAKAFQGNGIGPELVASITDDVAITMNIPFANCNNFGLKAFQDAGFKPALPGEIPAAAASVYNNRPMVFPIGNTFWGC